MIFSNNDHIFQSLLINLCKAFGLTAEEICVIIEHCLQFLEMQLTVTMSTLE
jgi:hypothetical protein